MAEIETDTGIETVTNFQVNFEDKKERKKEVGCAKDCVVSSVMDAN